MIRGSVKIELDTIHNSITVENDISGIKSKDDYVAKLLAVKALMDAVQLTVLETEMLKFSLESNFWPDGEHFKPCNEDDMDEAIMKAMMEEVGQ